MTKTCSIPDCGKPHKAHGYCRAHHMRWQRHGDPLGGRISQGDAARYFNDVVLPYEGEDCLAWPYVKDGKGYGQLWRDGSMKKVHRLVCEAVNGPAPTPEHQAAHLCGNSSCCAPRHTVWKTRAENEADKLAHGTHNRGERHYGAKLSESDVREIRALKGTEPQRSIANRFGVSPEAINHIQAGRNWSWL